MGRRPRLVAPEAPHHVTQRGNRRQQVFFGDHDYKAYLELIGESCRKAGTSVWCYCLMPNHVHFVLVPTASEGLRDALGPAHRAYALRVNRREEWQGHLWQDRFHSFPMDEPHLLAAARYIEQNPVRGGLVAAPQDWNWSSARAHLAGHDDGLVTVAPLLDMVPDWHDFLLGDLKPALLDTLRTHTKSGLPLGSGGFVGRLERRFGVGLRPAKRGRKPMRNA